MRLNFDYSQIPDISELRAVPGPKAPGLGEFECTLTSIMYIRWSSTNLIHYTWNYYMESCRNVYNLSLLYWSTQLRSKRQPSNQRSLLATKMVDRRLRPLLFTSVQQLYTIAFPGYATF